MIEFVWGLEFLSNTQKDLLEQDLRFDFHGFQDLESELMNKGLEIQRLSRILEKEREDKKMNIEKLEEILARVLKEIFGLKLEKFSPSDRSKFDKIIELEAKE